MSNSCHHCEKKFSFVTEGDTHSSTHMGKKTFHCSICQKSFSRKYNLKQHLIIHLGEKTYPCNQCPKAFSVNSSFKQHLRVHSGKTDILVRGCLTKFGGFMKEKCSFRGWVGVRKNETT